MQRNQSSGDINEIGTILITQGYKPDEINRSISQATKIGLLRRHANNLILRDERRELVRQYLLLDILANYSKEIKLGTNSSAANILIPGYGPFYGMGMDELVSLALINGGILKDDISHSQTFAADIKILSQKGLIMMR